MDYSPLTDCRIIELFVAMKDSLADIENYIIQRVREEREKRNISQHDLSLSLGMGSSFISHIEAPSKKAKYNIKHLNAIAKILNCSPKDFWPDEPL
ncbi:helix-turn-helix domain-containing protein [Sinomicrobium sp. M5D2P17]